MTAEPTTTLITGETVSTWSEAWRHEYEARHVVDLPERAQRADYLEAVLKRRGEVAAQALKDTVALIFKAKRSGGHG